MTSDDRPANSYEYPSPDCSRTFGAIAEFTEHAGEYQCPDWPDTPAGRKARSLVDVEFEEDQEDDLDE